MSDTPFAPGDTVALKSGGPAMTVEWCEKQYGAMKVCCVWFDSRNNQQQKVFGPATLKKVDV